MTRSARQQPKTGGFGAMVCWSAVSHLAVFFFFLYFHFPARYPEAPVYYVEVLNLPVANPQAGTPGEVPGKTEAPPAPRQPVPPAPREMALPAKPAGKAPTRPTTAPSPKKTEAAETEEFDKRIARLEREAAARHEAAALDTVRKRASGRGAVGMPGATGTEAGSDYASYIQSRLTDAFKSTIAFQSRNPLVMVRITINRTGRISQLRTERSTGDKLFEDAVARAIAKAEQSFPPLPKGNEIEIGFVFRPQGVGKK